MILLPDAVIATLVPTSSELRVKYLLLWKVSKIERKWPGRLGFGWVRPSRDSPGKVSDRI